MAQLVERHLAKVEAAGSSPVSRSTFKDQDLIIQVLVFFVIIFEIIVKAPIPLFKKAILKKIILI